jgi:hypothetical protein
VCGHQVLIFFVYTIFGVMGVQLFKGIFQKHCVPRLQCVEDAHGSGSWIAPESFAQGYCNQGNLNSSAPTSCQMFDVKGDTDLLHYSSGFSCQETALAVDFWDETRIHSGQYGYCSDVYICESGFQCVASHEQLHHGASSFDNILTTLVILFQIMTTEGWTTIFQPVLVVNDPYVVHLYFISLIFVTSFFMVNFVMAQMVVAFSRAVAVQAHIQAHIHCINL